MLLNIFNYDDDDEYYDDEEDEEDEEYEDDDPVKTTNTGRKRKRISKRTKELLYNEQKGKCMYCGVKLDKEHMDIDHIRAHAKGGSDDPQNLQILCRRCNNRKGKHLTDGEFRKKYKLLTRKASGGKPPKKRILYEHFDEIDGRLKKKKASQKRRQKPTQSADDYDDEEEYEDDEEEEEGGWGWF